MAPHADTGIQVIVETFSFSDCTLQDFYFFVDDFWYFLFVVQPVGSCVSVDVCVSKADF